MVQMMRNLVAIGFLLVASGQTAFADTFLYTPAARAGTNEALSCTVINVGSKPIPQVVVALVAYPPSNTGLGTATCPDLAPASTSTFGGVCSRGYAGPVEVFCGSK